MEERKSKGKETNVPFPPIGLYFYEFHFYYVKYWSEAVGKGPGGGLNGCAGG